MRVAVEVRSIQREGDVLAALLRRALQLERDLVVAPVGVLHLAVLGGVRVPEGKVALLVLRQIHLLLHIKGVAFLRLQAVAPLLAVRFLPLHRAALLAALKLRRRLVELDEVLVPTEVLLVLSEVRLPLLVPLVNLGRDFVQQALVVLKGLLLEVELAVAHI